MELIAARFLFNEKKITLRKAIMVLTIINHLQGTLMNIWDFMQNLDENFASANQLSWGVYTDFIEASDTVLVTEVLQL